MSTFPIIPLTSILKLLFFIILPIFLVYKLVPLIHYTYTVRKKYTTIPSFPRHKIWGNVVNVGPRLSPSINLHPDYAFEEMWHELGEPQAFMFDLAPVERCFLIVADPSVAESVVQPSNTFKYSVPKSDTFGALYRLIGWESMIMAEGEEWRNLRRRFNKGFSLQHLHSLGPLIISKTKIFVDRLQQHAEMKDLFTLKELAQDLTTDIITELTIQKDFHAQTTPEGQGHKGPLGVLTASRLLSSLCFKVGQGMDLVTVLDPIRPTKSWFYEQIFNRTLYTEIKKQLDTEKQQNQALPDKNNSDSVGSAKAIARLALSGLEPTPVLIKNTVSQLKSFLFAGQDTTATLIQWICYELSKGSYSKSHAKYVEKLVEEHNAVFGKESPLSALDVLSKPGQAEQLLGDKLPYTTAFVKETLRLHPPAATARLIPPISKANPTPYYLEINGKRQQVNGLRIYPSQWLIHRNPAVWGPDALEFKPDRWLDEEYMAKLPAGAWRPFERGPRNCIGQELAMIEGKIVLAAVTRVFKFTKVGYTGREVDGIKEEEVWNVHNVTSIPNDGMRMRVELRSETAVL